MHRGPSTVAPDAGVDLIVGYKLVKALAEIVLGVLMLVASRWVTHGLGAIARLLHDHATAAWSLALTHHLTEFVTQRHVFVVAVASLLDAALTLVEAWSLHKRFWWGPWLVIVTTSSLLPFEIASLARHPSGGRASILAFNALIVLYLLAFERRRHRRLRVSVA